MLVEFKSPQLLKIVKILAKKKKRKLMCSLSEENIHKVGPPTIRYYGKYWWRIIYIIAKLGSNAELIRDMIRFVSTKK